MNRFDRARLQHVRVKKRIGQLAEEPTALFVVMGDSTPRRRECVEADRRQIVGRSITDECLRLGLVAVGSEHDA